MQLPLAIVFPESATFENYEAGSNAFLLKMLEEIASGRGESQLYIWGNSGLGKTHLLQSTCRAASQVNRRSCYLPLSVMLQNGPGILQGLDNLDLIALDDLDRVITEDRWQNEVFSLINHCRTASVTLVFAARVNINGLNIQLADLKSRLAWGPVFEIRELDDESKKKVLKARAGQRNLELNDDAVNYMLSRYSRSMQQLCLLLERLDKASLSAQRRLTVPFIKSVLESGE
jgi:DnaA family protein